MNCFNRLAARHTEGRFVVTSHAFISSFVGGSGKLSAPLTSEVFMANRQTNEQLDRAGRLVLLGAIGSEAEIEAAASSPFVFTRTRAAIGEEHRRLDETGGWLSLFLVARRAVPVMALVAVLAAILTVWSAQLSAGIFVLLRGARPAEPPSRQISAAVRLKAAREF